MRTLVAVTVAAVATACASAPSAPGEPVAADRLYRSKCASCHRLYEPESRTRSGWDGVLVRMAPRAHLTAEQEASIRGFLEAHAADAEGGAR
jgi:hypothetical protein